MHTPAEQDAFGRAERRSHIEALVKKAIAGDVRAMEDLLACFQPLLRKLTNGAMQDQPRGEWDTTQAEVRLLFLSLLCEFEEQRGVPFLRYVKRMLPQRVSDFLRKERRRLLRLVSLDEIAGEGIEVAHYLPSGPDGQDMFDEMVIRLWLSQAMETLSEKQRRVMTLHLEGLTEREIASKLEVSQQGVHTLKSTAMRKLEQQWDES